ncbi:MAG TPA: hypothetical protein RMI62_12560, partial [Polyangiaceae bacterium LLY-WYZ-15_(1-7)]|nr:hypothetical protein [Polyangiaceae bacterium LLY-WYZ-15_(1-7)]
MARLQIETLVALDELPDGTCVAYPVVDPSWASAGSEEDALTELRLVLSEELAEAPPATVARFAIPP